MNVILIGIDTLRPDHLSCYGYKRKTSPNIDLLASKSLFFKKCFSQAYTTAPSFMSILTSRYPTYHGVLTTIGGKHGFGRAFAADAEIPTLAEIFKKNNYNTAAFTDGGNLYPGLGFEKGFDYYSINRSFGQRKALIPEKDIFYWISEHSKNNFFLFIHTYAVHSPWIIGEEYRNKFTNNKTSKDNSGERGQKNYGQMYMDELRDYTSLINSISARKEPDEIENLKNMYDSAISYVDEFMGKLWNFLATNNLREKTILVFTSDHGEEFLEHGELSHRQMYNELLHIPLIFYVPGIQPESLNQVTRSVDIFPTLLEFAKIKNTHTTHGKVLPDRSEEDSRLSIAEMGSQTISAQNSKYKYIYHAGGATKNKWAGVDELYDLENDPMEQNNISFENLDVVEELLNKFEEELHLKTRMPRPKKRVIYINLNSEIV